jgi:dienelactone hydrolase
MRYLVVATLIALAGVALQAKIKSEKVEYKEGDAVLEGCVVYDDAVKGPRPGVLVVHEWKGLGEYEMKRAEMLAQLGYVAFAADIYGKGVRAKSNDEAAQLAGKYKGDRALLRRRVVAAFEAMKRNPLVDSRRTAAIGYCFGGTTALELARSGANVKGVVSFHGGLDNPDPASNKAITARVLVLTGGDDKWVPPEQVAAFEEEMRKAGADWQVFSYGGAVHSFSNPASGDDPSKGVAYNSRVDRRSWEAMQVFFAEIFS